MAGLDYYKILGVSKTASDTEIKKAYRKLAMKYHPDHAKGDARAEERFKEISEAYELREVLEVNLIPKIVAQLDDDGEHRLKLALEEYLDAGRSGSLKLRLAKDMNFHMTLAEISNQSISIWMLRYLLYFLYLRFEKELIFSRPQESAAVEHQTILDCIMARNALKAKKAMQDHLRSVKKNVLEDLQNRMMES